MRRPAILDRLGVPGVAGLGLLLFSAAFHLAATAPARAELDDLRAEIGRLTAAAPGSRPAAVVPVQQLPSFAQAPELLKQINALAEKNGVAVTRSSYQVKAEDSTRVYEVDLPLRVAYPTLRAYLRDVLSLAPTARLDDLNLHRAQATDPVVDAEVRLSFSFAAAS